MRILYILFALFAAPAIGVADTINVPAEYATIQEAIDAAANGDTVLVAPGTYLENIDFVGKAITVVSSQGPEETVIDGGNPTDPLRASVVIFDSDEGPDSVIDGFTITNGLGGTLWWNNIEWLGGGICCWDNTSPTIRNNIIFGNYATNGGGGGVGCGWYSAATITNNIIYDNGANGSGGGGISGGCYSTGSIVNNLIYNNQAGSAARRSMNLIGRPSLMSGYGIRSRSLLAHGGGGGILFGQDSTVIVTNNTITENEAGYGGGGIACLLDASLTVTNTVLWNDTAPNGPEIYMEGAVSVSYSDVEGGEAAVYEVTGSALTWGPGNIDADPLFVDSGNKDFHLLGASPCIDAGDNSASLLPAYDIDGDDRIIYGKGVGFPIAPYAQKPVVEMGADEFLSLMTHPFLRR